MNVFFELLPDTIINWIIENSTERHIETNKTLIKEGDYIESLYIVLEGLFGIYLTSVDNKLLRLCGPGSVLGEISFIDDVPASASVIANEASLILELPRSKLTSKMETEPSFEAAFNKALAVILSRRLRNINQKFFDVKSEGIDTSLKNEIFQKTLAAIDSFKKTILQKDKDINKNDCTSEEAFQHIFFDFSGLGNIIHKALGPESELNEYLKEQLESHLQHELLPFVLMTETTERFYSKPRGYAGDYLTIEKIYLNRPAGIGRLGPIIDHVHLEAPSARAVRNRRGLLVSEIKKTLSSKRGKRIKIMSLACGPAREIFDVYEEMEDKTLIETTLLDIDCQALAFVDELRHKKKLTKQISLLEENLIYLSLGRKKTEIDAQDLIYSIGLIDYFNDKLVIKLLNYIYKALAPGGRVILGNFHPNNIYKEYMDYVLEWNLIHRTEEDMNRLLLHSEFKCPYTNIYFEDENVNLFVECVKE
jgi:CRP-like cAMP-binding protein/SAM-dependent methyltransferase